MKYTSPMLVFLSAILISGSVSDRTVLAGNNPTEDPTTIAAYMELAQPGPEHARLANLAGDWTQTVRMWMQPGGEPMEFDGTSHNEMILDGRFLECRGTSGEGPMQITSLQIIGFDRRTEEYTVTGYDTWGTYSVFAHGPYHADRKAIVMAGSDYDPVLQLRQEFEMHLRFLDDDSFGWDVVFTDSAHAPGGEPFRMVEITYHRADQ